MTTQPESAFLAKLPLEIRCQIYELVFGDKIIAILPRDRYATKIYHYLCHAKGHAFHWFVWISGDGNESPGVYCRAHENNPVSNQLLPLLLTCHQTYSEAVDVLWSTNPIHIQPSNAAGLAVLSALQATIPARSFHSIRCLEISFLHGAVTRVPQILDEDWFCKWESMWDVIKTMKGLVRINAWLKMDQRDKERGLDGLNPREKLLRQLDQIANGNRMTADQEARLFAPLMDLTWLREFTVEVTWAANEGSENFLSRAPFQLTRNNDPIPGKPGMGIEIINGELVGE
ncbi:uncharacterized protein DSM5745_06435 [Aspergillus mulundensis]|uniref:DUF7730 domain-containing protein n=1 Tax=Aspergillus mulundensis TaxID=1810919 RepID=A0A3D8RQU0_9EURO|nr:hypothetical protein DSM5745_06435 [Aspergillus mulundensis]RDW76443.1 hypothetical protein DSM5745_06435 [Aspergillus mulundensis]